MSRKINILVDKSLLQMTDIIVANSFIVWNNCAILFSRMFVSNSTNVYYKFGLQTVEN